MAEDKLTVVKSALYELGEGSVESLSETPSSRKVNDVWDEVRRMLLRDFPFNFARRRATLVSTTPSTEQALHYQYAFDKPADWLKTIAVSYDGDFDRGALEDYADEGDVILTGYENSYLYYICDHDTPEEWDSLFDVLMAQALAAKMALTITASKTTKDMIEDKLRATRAMAQVQTLRDLGPKRKLAGNFRSGRYGYRSGWQQGY